MKDKFVWQIRLTAIFTLNLLNKMSHFVWNLKRPTNCYALIKLNALYSCWDLFHTPKDIAFYWRMQYVCLHRAILVHEIDTDFVFIKILAHNKCLFCLNKFINTYIRVSIAVTMNSLRFIAQLLITSVLLSVEHSWPHMMLKSCTSFKTASHWSEIVSFTIKNA